MKTKRVLGVLAGSLFAVLIMFTMGACDDTSTSTTPPAATVTSVTVTPATTSVDTGSTRQFSAAVEGTNNPSQSVTWGVTGNSDADTTISADGLLTVGAAETEGAILTITATSTVDTTQSGTAVVTVYYRSLVPVVRSVSVDPPKGHAQKGGTIQFTATVSVSGPIGQEPATTVTWSIEETGRAAGTTISAAGLLTIASDEGLTALTVKATSTELDNKSGTARATVVPVFTGTASATWTDGQIPASTIEFISNSAVRLTGRYWSQHNNGTGAIAGDRAYELANDWSGETVEPAVWVVLDSTNRIGFELYYYYPMSNGQPERLVAYVNGLQPRVFYKPGDVGAPVTPPGPGGITDTANPAQSALVTYFSGAAIDVGLTSGFGTTITAPGLVITNNTSLQSGVRINGTLTYTDEAAGGPVITYRLVTDNPATYDIYSFSQAEGDAIAAAISSNLGTLAGTIADITAGYKYFGGVTAELTAFPDAGKLDVKIALAKDAVADGIVAAITGAITDVQISGSGATITGAAYTASYVSATHTLEVTVPAAGISASGATAVARALSTAITGKISVTDDAEHVVPASATGVVSSGDVVASIKLAQTAVTATPITAAVTAVTTPALTIASTSSVTSNVITALANITDATGTANATYDSTRHEVVITVAPAANMVFNTAANTYSAVATALNTKFAGAGVVTNSVDTTYSTVNAVTAAITGGNLVFTVSFSNYIAGATITAALATATGGATIASATSVTGDVITKLANIANATGTVTTAYSSANHTFAIRVAPATGLTFNPGLVQQGANVVSPYAAVGTEIVTKLGATVTNNVDNTYTNVKSSVGIEVVGGDLVFTVQTATAVPAATLTAAITGAADGNISLIGAANDFFGATYSGSGAIISALQDLAPMVTVAVTYSDPGDFFGPGNGSITLTLTPGGDYVFGAAAEYTGVATALFAKPITSISDDRKGVLTLRQATGVTHAVTNGNLVLTIATAPAP